MINTPPAGTRPASTDQSVLYCMIATQAGIFLTESRAVLIARDDRTELRATEFSRPGALLNAFINRGLRRYLLAFEDGRTFGADLVDTTWGAGGRRLCRFLLDATTSVA
jgi:hypothetical protein